MIQPRILVLSEDCESTIEWLADLIRVDTTYTLEVCLRAEFLAEDATHFDIILVEIEPSSKAIALPFCQLLRAKTRIPILVISSLEDEELILALYDAAIDDYILKPITPQVLHAKLAAWRRWISDDHQ